MRKSHLARNLLFEANLFYLNVLQKYLLVQRPTATQRPLFACSQTFGT